MRIKSWNISFLLCCFLLPISAVCSDESLTVMSVTSIYDGDTFTVTFADCRQSLLCARIPVRIDGIDAPEMRGKCPAEIERAKAAKQFLVARIRAGSLIELKGPVRDKYYRVRASVWIDGVDVGEAMIQMGLARRYDGLRRSGWCDSLTKSASETTNLVTIGK